MKIGYARVSTDEQNLDLQRDALETAGCDEIFVDEGISGVTIERDGLSQALSMLGEADTLVVWKLDRLGRSLGFLIDLVARIEKDGGHFQSLQDGIDTTTANGRLLFHMVGALAEFERSLISERTKAGMAAAKRRGRKLGRKTKLDHCQLTYAREQITKGKISMSALAQLYGVATSTLSRSLRRQKDWKALRPNFKRGDSS